MKVIGLAGLLALVPVSSLAATFQFSGTVTDIIINVPDNFSGSPNFVETAAFGVGDPLSLSIDVVDTATASSSSITDFYRNIFVDVTGTVGGFAFEDGRNGLSPVLNDISVLGANGPNANGDRVSGRRTVVGSSFGGWSVNTLIYRLVSTENDKLADNSYGPFLFEQSFVDSFDFPGNLSADGVQLTPADRTEVALLFRNPDFPTTVTVVADIRTPAPVPLPSAFGFLALALGFVGLGKLARLGSGGKDAFWLAR